VDFPIKMVDLSIAMLVYQRVFPIFGKKSKPPTRK
jgi:hypothetical protein